MPAPRLLSPAEAADILHVSTKTLTRFQSPQEKPLNFKAVQPTCDFAQVAVLKNKRTIQPTSGHSGA